MQRTSNNQAEAHPKPVRTFWQRFPEKEELNQYWYSVPTVDKLADEVIAQTEATSRCAFLSTPSVYYALKAKTISSQRELFLFDYDKKFASEKSSFVHYDFNKPEDIPKELHQTIDYIVIDPPFITKEVWVHYTNAAKLLLRPTTGKILLSTIVENEELIKSLLGCSIQRFKPSIPHLVYQYALYANYASLLLSDPNPEVDSED